MYETFFGLKRRPFLFMPDVETYYSTECMEETRQTVECTIQLGEGISLIFGAAGTGKTLLMQLLRQSLESEYAVVFVSHCHLESPQALFCQLSHDLHIDSFGGNPIELRLQILDFARQELHQDVVLLFDDAQHLSPAVLEEIRLLTDSVRGSAPLFRAVLAGTMELEETLTLPHLEAFNQRVVSRCYLETFSKEETSQYIVRQTDDLRIDHSLKESTPIFSEEVKQQIYRLTDGLPRLINQLCGAVLQLAAERETVNIDNSLVTGAWTSLQHIESADKLDPFLPAVVHESVISPDEIEEIVDQKKKTFQLRPFNSIEFGPLADSDSESSSAARSLSENEYKPPYPEDDEEFADAAEEIIEAEAEHRDFSSYRLQLHVPLDDDVVEDAIEEEAESLQSESLVVPHYKLVLNFQKRLRKYRRKILLRKIQNRLGLYAGLLQKTQFPQTPPPTHESEMNMQSLQEYGAAVLDGRPPFVRKKFHYAYQTDTTQRDVTYPDPETGVPVVLRWLPEEMQDTGHIAISYSEFLNGKTENREEKPKNSVIQTEMKLKKPVSDAVVCTSLNASQNVLVPLVPSGIDETFTESHRVDEAAISLAELFRVNSSALQRTQESAEFRDLDETVQRQLATVIQRISRAAERIEQAAEASELAGQHVTRAAEFVETEVKSALPTYLDLFKELSEFQQQVSAELESVRKKHDESPKFRTFPRRQVLIERTVPTIDVETLLR